MDKLFLSMEDVYLTKKICNFDFNNIPENKAVIIYNGLQFSINKYLFGIYSKKFRESAGIFEASEFTFDDVFSVECFTVFVEAAQGREFRLDSNIFFDFIMLCVKWGSDSILKKAYHFFKQHPNIGTAMDLILEHQNKEYVYVLCDLVAMYFENAMLMKSFLKLPYEILQRIVSSKNLKAKNMKKFHNYVLKRFDTHTFESFELYRHIDLQSLSLDDAKRIFNQPNVLKFISSNKPVTTSDTLFSNMDNIKNTINDLEKKVKKLEKIKIMEGFKNIKTNFTNVEKSITNRIKNRKEIIEKKTVIDDRIETIFFKYADRFAEQIFDFESNIKKSNNTVFHNLMDGIKILENKITALKSENIDIKRMLRLSETNDLSLSQSIRGKN